MTSELLAAAAELQNDTAGVPVDSAETPKRSERVLLNIMNKVKILVVSPDAVEVLVKVGGTWFAPRNTKMAAEAILRNLASQGYTLRRETMTEAELEREACYLHRRAQAGNDTVDEIMALAKKYRG